MESDNLKVENNEAAGQFEVHFGDAVALLTYRRDDPRIIFIHTQVPKEMEGRGIAGRVAQTALEFARTEGLAVVPACPYVAGYIARHPEYEDLVVRDGR